MKVNRAQIEQALARPADTRLFLLHGPDEAGSRALARSLDAAMGADCERIDLTVGSFDDPAAFFPTANFGIESKHAAWEDTSHLPGHKVVETESVIKRWAEAGLEVPE